MKTAPLSSGPVLLASVALAFAGAPAHAQIILNQSQTPEALVYNVLAGDDVFPSNVRFNDYPGNTLVQVGDSAGEYGHFNGAACNVGLPSGVFLCTNLAMQHIPGPNDRLEPAGGGFPFIQSPDLDLCQLTGDPNCQLTGGTNIYSKAVLDFDFVALNDLVSFRYVFSSEEYERWVCTQYNDAFGWFVRGPGISGPFTGNAMNIAFIPGSLSAVCINAVNSGNTTANANGPLLSPFQFCEAADPNWLSNTPYYRYNGGWFSGDMGPQTEPPYNSDPYYIQHNGLTVVLTASVAVQIGETYHMKMALGNVADWRYPSAVFIEQQSFRASDRFTLTVDAGANVDLSGATPVLHQSGTEQVTMRINRWGAFYLDEDVQISVQGDAVAGVDYEPALPTSVHFNQLDSAVTINLTFPVEPEVPSDLVVVFTTADGKVQEFPLIIEEELTTGLLEPAVAALGLFPNPAENNVQVALPAGMQGPAHLELRDLAGRVVLQQQFSSTTAILDLQHLPTGLYALTATAPGQVATARLSVRR